MAREYMPKLAIAILALSAVLVLVTTQPNIVAAAPAASVASPSSPTSYSPTYTHYHWGGGYWGGYYGGYYGWYPYYSYYYPYYYSYYYPYYYGNYYGSYSYAPTSYTLTVNTNPSNLGTVNGGGSYTPGSSASFSVTQTTIQVSPNTRYVFDHWSGDYSGAGTSATVTVNNAMTITAVYDTQYYLTVNAQPQSAPTPQGGGWYNSGDTATVQSGGQTVGDSGSRLVFQGWSVDGAAPQSGSTLSLVMNAAHTATATYGQQYYLNVQTDQGVATGSGWYDAGTTASIYVSTPISTQYGVNIVFNGWQGDIQSGNQSTTVLMDGPKNVVATWRTDATVLYLTIGAIIVAAVLIIAGVIAFLARGRSGIQSSTTQRTTNTTTPGPAESTVEQKPTTETVEQSNETKTV